MTAIATAIAAAASAPASAAILYNSVEVVVYLGFGGLPETPARHQAALNNPLISIGSITAGFTDTGSLNVNTPKNNGRAFFNSGGGVLSYSSGLNITACNAFGNADSALTSSPSPTSSTPTGFSNLNSSKWDLVYLAVNGLPEVLSMDVTSRVSEPATLGIIGLGLGLLGTVTQRRKKA
jgi:hypothetical protein